MGPHTSGVGQLPYIRLVTPRVALLVLLFLPACASQTTLRRHGRMALEDFKAAATAPVRADAGNWKKAGLVTAGILAAATLDDEGETWMSEHQSESLDEFSEAVTPLGGRYSERILLGTYLYGAVAKSEGAKAVAFDGMMASILASKIITPAIKTVTGRERPGEAADAWEFDDGSSFPSNHATQAFALAAVIAAHSDQRWLDWTAYSLATAVAFARMYNNAHFLSDVVAGAAIGISVGRMVVRVNRSERSKWTIQPTTSTRGAPGFAFSYRF